MKKEEVSVLERIRRLIEPDEKREQTAKGQGPEAETNEEAEASESEPEAGPEAGPEADTEVDTEDTGSARVAEPRLGEAEPESKPEAESESEPEAESSEARRIKELEAEIERLHKQLDEKEKEVATARTEGEIEGRNARIEEFLVTDPDDSIPSPGASAPQSSAADSIFSLAAGAR